MPEISAAFTFVARNPPSIAIAGGILMWLVGSLLKAVNGGGGDLIAWAPWAFFGGIVLQLLWLIFVPSSRGGGL